MLFLVYIFNKENNVEFLLLLSRIRVWGRGGDFVGNRVVFSIRLFKRNVICNSKCRMKKFLVLINIFVEINLRERKLL